MSYGSRLCIHALYGLDCGIHNRNIVDISLPDERITDMKYMYRVESIATPENDSYSPGLAIPHGTKGANGYQDFDDLDDALREAQNLTDMAVRFEDSGYGRQFYGRVSIVQVKE